MIETAFAKNCPRCNQLFVKWHVGTSRLDSKTIICTECEVDESLEDYYEGGVTPMTHWPLDKPWSPKNDLT